MDDLSILHKMDRKPLAVEPCAPATAAAALTRSPPPSELEASIAGSSQRRPSSTSQTCSTARPTPVTSYRTSACARIRSKDGRSGRAGARSREGGSSNSSSNVLRTSRRTSKAAGQDDAAAPPAGRAVMELEDEVTCVEPSSYRLRRSYSNPPSPAPAITDSTLSPPGCVHSSSPVCSTSTRPLQLTSYGF